MSKIILVYASMTGNTEDMANSIAEGIAEAGIELVVKEVLDASPTELQEYDGIVLGAYTWGDGELPDEFLDFYDDLLSIDLTGKKAVVFGSCDSNYRKYGAAVDLLVDRFNEIGAEVVLDGLKVELSPTNEEKEHCKDFGKTFAEHLKS